MPVKQTSIPWTKANQPPPNTTTTTAENSLARHRTSRQREELPHWTSFLHVGYHQKLWPRLKVHSITSKKKKSRLKKGSPTSKAVTKKKKILHSTQILSVLVSSTCGQFWPPGIAITSAQTEELRKTFPLTSSSRKAKHRNCFQSNAFLQRRDRWGFHCGSLATLATLPWTWSRRQSRDSKVILSLKSSKRKENGQKCL